MRDIRAYEAFTSVSYGIAFRRHISRRFLERFRIRHEHNLDCAASAAVRHETGNFNLHYRTRFEARRYLGVPENVPVRVYQAYVGA